MFGKSSRRRLELLIGLSQAVSNLFEAGAEQIYLGGSFVSSKINPNDVDGCWRPIEGIDRQKLDPVFLDFQNQRQEMKRKYSVDFFVTDDLESGSGATFLEFFQTSRDNEPRGLILLEKTT